MHLPTFTLPRLIGAAVVAGAAVVIPVAAVAGTAASAGAAPAHCPTAGLVVWLDTDGNGAAGSSFYTLELTNLSGQACTLGGYPGVSGVNLTGQQIGAAATRNSARTPHVVTLARGATATTVLQIVDAGNYPVSTCHPVTAAGLRVYPPGSATSKVVPYPFPACSGTHDGYLSVEAVTHG